MRGFTALIGVLIGVMLVPRGTYPGRAVLLESEPIPPSIAISSTSTGAISHEVREQMEAINSREKLTVIITIDSPPEIEASPPYQSSLPATNLVRKLQADANRSQASVLQYLKKMESSGWVQDITPFWIFNGIAITASPQVIQELGNRPDVIRIDPNRIFYSPSVDTEQASPLNIEAIHAPALWEMGYRGQGIVVANMDTGVLVDHPDLASTWRAGNNSWYDTTGQYPDRPFDTDGHGTCTMGVMVGGDESGQTLGVAPEAEWIAVRIFDDDGLATSIRIHLGFQWLLDPDGDPDTDDAPHIVNNSWAFQSNGCFLDFLPDIMALRAAGILPIFAAGNAGPGSNTGLSPSNNPGAFSVGALDYMDIISASSSRGPSICGQEEQIFPSIVSPGISIPSTGLNNGYTYASGTSLAAPHVAGALALLLSAYPGLSVDEQERILIESAKDLGPDGPDNDYGYGKLDVLHAYRLLAGQPVPPAQPGNPIEQINGEILYLPLLTGISQQ
jgi:subtilisin family serine protease